jgi:protein SCO1/2
MRERIAPNPNDNVASKQVDGIRIDDTAGKQLPTDLQFKDQNGQDVKIGSYFDGARPVVMVMAYYNCTMLCGVVLNGITNALKEVAWNAGEAYRVVVVSIDPRDTPDAAKKKKEIYVGQYGRTVKPDAWTFLTGDEKNTRAFADAIGFHYRWDASQEQYAHAAGTFIVTPTGKVSRVFYGISFPPQDLRLALAEASDGHFKSAVDQLLLLCFHYDPTAGKYVIAATRLMTAGGIATVLALGLFVGRMMKHDKKATV